MINRHGGLCWAAGPPADTPSRQTQNQKPPRARRPGRAWAKGGSRAPSPRSSARARTGRKEDSVPPIRAESQINQVWSIIVRVGVLACTRPARVFCWAAWLPGMCEAKTPHLPQGWAARHTATMHCNIFVAVGVEKARRAAALFLAATARTGGRSDQTCNGIRARTSRCKQEAPCRTSPEELHEEGTAGPAHVQLKNSILSTQRRHSSSKLRIMIQK